MNKMLIFGYGFLVFVFYALIIEAYTILFFMIMLLGFIIIVARLKKYRYLFEYIEYKFDFIF